jgi:hypothetical protein
MIQKEENLKDAFAIVGLLFAGLITYWYVTGGPYKSM